MWSEEALPAVRVRNLWKPYRLSSWSLGFSGPSPPPRTSGVVGLWDVSGLAFHNAVFSPSLIKPEPTSIEHLNCPQGEELIAFFPTHPRSAQRFHEFHQVTVTGAHTGLCAICVCVWVWQSPITVLILSCMMPDSGSEKD